MFQRPIQSLQLPGVDSTSTLFGQLRLDDEIEDGDPDELVIQDPWGLEDKPVALPNTPIDVNFDFELELEFSDEQVEDDELNFDYNEEEEERVVSWDAFHRIKELPNQHGNKIMTRFVSEQSCSEVDAVLDTSHSKAIPSIN